MGSAGANNWPLHFSGAVLHAPTPPHRPVGEAAHATVRQEPPKLEDFLGAQQESTTTAPENDDATRPFGATTTTIGLSMIKNWLRSQPAPASVRATTYDNVVALMPLPPDQGDRTAVASGPGAAGVEAAHKKAAVAAETFGQRTSVYRGVTKHRWTGRYEAHLWDNSCRREGQTRKGRQVYLGGYDKEEKAARAYDLAALKYWGTTTTTNFPVSEYEKELEEMKHMSRQEYVASLRRKSSGFSRGASIYRGVTRHHQHGRWQARIGRVAGNKDLYLGTFSTQEEAAEAYDIAAIKFRGLNAVTNFDMSRYDVQSIMESRIPIGGSGAAKRMKGDMPPELSDVGGTSNLLTDGIGSYTGMQHDTSYGGWAPLTFLPPALPLQYSDGGHGGDPVRTMWCKQEEQADGAVVKAAYNLHNLQHFPFAVGSTHNFFQPSSAHHGLMGFGDMMQHPQSMEYSTSVMYGGSGSGYHHAASMSHGGGGYAIPVAKLVEHGAGGNEEDGPTTTVVSDLYNGRQNLYYLSHDSPPLSNASKENSSGQGVEYEHWDSPESSVMARKATDLMVGHGLPLYQGNGT